MKNKYLKKQYFKNIFILHLVLLFSFLGSAQVVLENEIKITDLGLHFNGSKVGNSSADNGSNTEYDYVFGRNISAHGDCIKTYGDYVFMTWYRGGKTDRHVMLTRYNTVTQTIVTIEFPHRHTGFQNRWWLGESHNAIAIGVSPLNGTIHLLYDMHAYSSSRPSNGSLANDYFRYSYSIENAASLPDEEFTLDKFVQNSSGGYKHLRLTGSAPQNEFIALTYPNFFLNDAGDLFMWMREGGNNNGMYKFSRYDATTATWSNFIDFNALNARSQPDITYNWGLYGDIKYVNGKMRIGFQRRSQNNNDKFEYQNGVYYAYSDDQSGATDWKNHQGQNFSTPLYDADFIKVMEPGDYVQGTNTNALNIVAGFDWTVTENDDVHIISRVRDNQFGVTKNLHTYKPSGATDFITSEDFSGASSIYTSGNDVFIIGLSGGRVFVEKTEGGTNNFTRVYQATSGRTFDHGRVYVDNGKLYYYLMENASGSAQPLYLQIIDLGIVKDPFRVSLSSPSNGASFSIGETIQISANAVDENSHISKVEFWINGSYFGEDNSIPYTLDWSPTVEGDYTLQAIAYNTNNQTVSSIENTVNVSEFDPTDLTGDIYRIKNFVTGKYLHSVGSDVVESDNATNVASGDKEWEFVKAGDYYNIESKRSDRGILRAAGNPPNDIINTGFSAPREDSDKQFSVAYNSSDGTYQFLTRNNSNYLFQNTSGIIEHIGNSNDRSKWIVESTTLSTTKSESNMFSARVFPNPAKNQFTILLNGVNKATVVINDMLGKVIFQNKVNNSNRIYIENNGRFKTGLYLIKVIDDKKRVFYSKLIVN
ncbi:BNR-4 repeat-containing protein [Algibacter pectinivorans]|uniref:Por secretion system C-terminal sorting domain-containing protein n=1 Tax=Algibacter pectinivorans TaxID=870482 RepID=A0A1I1R0C6_9FLAO|nr:BNR-4 repeat-containing protein [Algibacter pectinivorans]SFD27765.1 Por secretion system C-terminal sorting domain-containing protein [Algibacter pectinivorans]